MTMTNAEWVISTGHHFKQLRLIQHNELANRTYTVALCDEPIAELKDKGEPLDVFRRWLDQEHIEPILDDAEREYLSAVIRPFRGRVKYIKKIDCACEEYIHIQLNKDWTIFPHFRTGTMYKGMKPDHAYTLEELGL